MALGQPFGGKPRAAHRTVAFDRLEGVVRAAGVESATGWSEGGTQESICPQQREQQRFQVAFAGNNPAFARSRIAVAWRSRVGMRRRPGEKVQSNQTSPMAIACSRWSSRRMRRMRLRSGAGPFLRRRRTAMRWAWSGAGAIQRNSTSPSRTRLELRPSRDHAERSGGRQETRGIPGLDATGSCEDPFFADVWLEEGSSGRLARVGVTSKSSDESSDRTGPRPCPAAGGIRPRWRP